MMLVVELHQLEYFVAVVEEGSFTRGADRAHVVQSATSAAVAKLEREFGLPLLDRTGRRVEPTEAGRALLRHARVIRRAARDAVEELAGLRGGPGGPSGTVILGTLLSSGSVDLPAVLGGFHRRFPEVSVRLRPSPGRSAALFDGVLAGRIDLGLVIVPERPPAGIELDPIGTIQLSLVCAPDHPLAGRRGVRYAALAAETFVDFPEGWGNREAVDAVFAAERVERTVAIEVSDIASALDLVAGGLGLAFLPAQHVLGRSDLATVDLLRLPRPSRLGLAAPAGRALTPAAQALRAAIRALGDGLS
jgi:DNA-binding transcriptional LysR family regulator